MSDRDPLICRFCGREMDLWKIWHPKYGTIYDEGENLKAGKYEKIAKNRDGTAGRGRIFPLAPLRRSTIIAVPGAGVKCGSTRRSSISSLALPNLREEKWLCLLLGVLAVTGRLWNTPGSKVRPKGAKFKLRKYASSTGKSLSEIVTQALEAFLHGIHGRG